MFTDKHKIASMLMFVVLCLLYYTLTIPSNSIWEDQILAINIAKDILEGNFPFQKITKYFESDNTCIYPINPSISLGTLLFVYT